MVSAVQERLGAGGLPAVRCGSLRQGTHQIRRRPRGDARSGEVAVEGPDVGIRTPGERQDVCIARRAIAARDGVAQRSFASLDQGGQPFYGEDGNLLCQPIDDFDKVRTLGTEGHPPACFLDDPVGGYENAVALHLEDQTGASTESGSNQDRRIHDEGRRRSPHAPWPRRRFRGRDLAGASGQPAGSTPAARSAASSSARDRFFARRLASVKTAASPPGSGRFSGMSTPMVRSPDLMAVGPGRASIVSPEIFCKARMLMCDMALTYAHTYKYQGKTDQSFTATGRAPSPARCRRACRPSPRDSSRTCSPSGRSAAGSGSPARPAPAQPGPVVRSPRGARRP
jgi:hypothetical protein